MEASKVFGRETAAGKAFHEEHVVGALGAQGREFVVGEGNLERVEINPCGF